MRNIFNQWRPKKTRKDLSALINNKGIKVLTQDLPEPYMGMGGSQTKVDKQ